MRLDKFITSAGLMSRTECARAAKAGRITVDGEILSRADAHIEPEKCVVRLDGVVIEYREFSYIMLNKPQGYISATDDPRGEERTVLDLLPERYKKSGIFPCGRLDKDTMGLLILTDDGTLAHRLLSPKYHVDKVYAFKCAEALTDDAKAALEGGLDLAAGEHTLPATVALDTPISGTITIHEGKYHQIKRMFGAVGNRITMLERTNFGEISLDRSLKRGDWRYLTSDEQAALKGDTGERGDALS